MPEPEESETPETPSQDPAVESDTPSLDPATAQFVNAYTSLLIAAWTDEAVAEQLAADPTAYAIQRGLPVAEGAVVQVDDSPHDGLFTLEEVMTSWNATPGVHILHVPATPVIDLDELDEADLEAISAGAVAADNNNNNNNGGGGGGLTVALCIEI
jgi:hypothetical protein